jgi:copper oxidase (laccase) domain-containing protein
MNEVENPLLNNGIRYFPRLFELGVINGFTDRETFGNMKFRGNERDILELVDSFLDALKVNDDFPLIYMRPESGGDVRFVDQQNLYNYRDSPLIKKTDLDSRTIYHINCDGFVTDLPIPIYVAPADCAIVVTLFEKETGGRVMSVIHSGLTGTLSEIYQRGYKMANQEFKLKGNPEVFIFPTIRGHHYIKSVNFLKYKEFPQFNKLAKLNSPEWLKYIKEIGEGNMELDVLGRLLEQIEDEGVKASDIFLSSINTYDGHKEGSVISQTFSKKHNNGEDSHRFGICVQIKDEDKI